MKKPNIILLVFAPVLLGFLVKDANGFHTIISPYTGHQIFPANLYCSDVESGEGQSWENITIGVSSVDELKETVIALNPNYMIVEDENEIRFIMENPNEIATEQIPSALVGCIKDQIVTVLRLSIHHKSPPDHLSTFLAKYGRPDAVTWSSLAGSRLLLWFEQGIAVEVDVARHTVNNPEIINVASVIYFPFQESLNYKDRWPYNQTLTSPLQGEIMEDNYYITDQNPFNFQVIIVTITAQPSHTPTPTFTPRPTLVSTPKPNSS